jgi:glycosyltransferase involved in cell wall biosynthesis
VELLADEPSRQRRAMAARALVQVRYAWDGIARRLLQIYEEAAA